MAITHWMSWEGAVDLVAITGGGSQLNVILHLARMVHTPVGSAPAGMVLWQPDPSAAPLLAGFVSSEMKVASYFGSTLFAGTPFENAPTLHARLDLTESLPAHAQARLEVNGLLFEVKLAGLGELEAINRPASVMTPFTQQVMEAIAGQATLKVNGLPVSLVVPPIGITGGPAAVWSAAGIYAR